MVPQESYEDGTHLVRQGEPGSLLFVVEAGEVMCTHRSTGDLGEPQEVLPISNLHLNQRFRIAATLQHASVTDLQWQHNPAPLRPNWLSALFMYAATPSLQLFLESGAQSTCVFCVQIMSFGPGQYFGENALLDNYQYNASAVARGRVSVLRASKADFNMVRSNNS